MSPPKAAGRLPSGGARCRDDRPCGCPGEDGPVRACLTTRGVSRLTGRSSRDARLGDDAGVGTLRAPIGGAPAAAARGLLSDALRRHRAPIRVLAAAAVAALLVWRVEWDAAGRLSEPAAWPLIIAAAAAGLLAVPLKLVAWRITVVEVMPVPRRVPYRALAAPLAVGAALNTMLPARAGELARIALARRRLGREGEAPSAAALAGSIASESLYAGVAWAALLAGVALVEPVPIAAWVAGAVLSFAFATSLLVMRRTPGPVAGSGSRGALAAALLEGWRSLMAGQRLIRRPRVFATLAVASLGTWIVQVVAVALVLGAFGLGRAVGLAGAALVVVILAVVQFVPVLPGNIGLFQAAVALPLVATYGVDADVAVVVGTVLQAVQVLPLLVLAGVLMVADRLGSPRTPGVARAPATGGVL